MSECAWKQKHKIVVGPITLPDCMSGMYVRYYILRYLYCLFMVDGIHDTNNDNAYDSTRLTHITPRWRQPYHRYWYELIMACLLHDDILLLTVYSEQLMTWHDTKKKKKKKKKDGDTAYQTCRQWSILH